VSGALHVVDSSAWLEYFAYGPNAERFAQAFENPSHLRVPSIILSKVFKRVSQERNQSAALVYVAVMQQSEVVELDAPLAVSAATHGRKLKLPLACLRV